MHHVTRYLAGEGHYVAVVSEAVTRAFHGRSLPSIEKEGSIQTARLGWPLFHRTMLGLFFARLAETATEHEGARHARQFDIVLDFVEGTPFPVHKYIDTPVVPVVFRLSRKLRASDEPPGPMIAVTEHAFAALNDAGVPRNFIVRAPFGAERTGNGTPLPDEAAGEGLVIITDTPDSKVLAKALAKSGLSAQTKVRVVAFDEVSNNSSARGAAVGWCARGHESMAVELGARGIPVLAPDTFFGQQLVRCGETGLLHRAGNNRDLSRALRKLGQDEALRERMGHAAAQSMQDQTWQRTGNLVLATLENTLKQHPAHPPE